MNKIRILLLICLAFLLIAATSISASPAIDWWHIGGGGSSVSQDGRVLDGVVGQGVIGRTNVTTTELCSGYLCMQIMRSLYLPIITKNNP